MLLTSLATFLSSLTFVSSSQNITYSFSSEDNRYIYGSLVINDFEDINTNSWHSVQSYYNDGVSIPQNFYPFRFKGEYDSQTYKYYFTFGFFGGASNYFFGFNLFYHGGTEEQTISTEYYFEPLRYDNGTFDIELVDYVVDEPIYLDLYISLFDFELYSLYFGNDSDVDNAYQSGYSQGFKDGYTSGESEGYTTGNTQGYNEGYYVGFDTGKIAGFDEGYESALQTHDFSFTNLFASLADTPILMIRRLFGFELFGVGLVSVFMSLFTALIVIHLIKKVF